MIKNNLFGFATKELSQDAFICWLMNFAHSEHLEENPVLTECAKELLAKMLKIQEPLVVTSIKRQYKKIDVLIEVNNKYNIIIEDKTFTSEHNDQIKRYRKVLEDENVQNIICVYYKIVEENFTGHVDVQITRKDLIDVFTKYINTAENAIFTDYYENLLEIETETQAYMNTKIELWRIEYNHVYRGFFSHLINNNIINLSRRVGWGYIPNQSNGFWGLWWYYLSNEELIACNLKEEFVDEVYLQIEDNLIAVKMTVVTEKSNDVRWSLFKYFESKTPEFQKKVFRNGKHMTIGYITYDEKNYKERINLMQDIMDSIAKGEYRFKVN